jgi:IclR family transcriptional regulator, acetate operon repressor
VAVDRPTSSAVDKALDLIEVIARGDRPLRLTDLANEVGMHRATAYRVLADLVARGWVLRAGDRYLPGSAVLQLSRAATEGALVELIRPILQRLSEETSMMVNLQVLERRASRVIHVIRPRRLEMLADLYGESLPAHRYAGPLALVSALPHEARKPYLEAAAEVGYDDLSADIERTIAHGHALERGRHAAIIASISRAVTSSRGLPICALTVVGLDAEFWGEALTGIEACLRTAVEAASYRLAGPYGDSNEAETDTADEETAC